MDLSRNTVSIVSLLFFSKNLVKNDHLLPLSSKQVIPKLFQNCPQVVPKLCHVVPELAVVACC